MKEQIIVIGSGGSGDVLAAKTALHDCGRVIMVSPEEVAKIPFSKTEPLILHNAYPSELKGVYEGRQFVCKGRHQYRLVETIKDERANGTFLKEVWACQCGKKLS